MLCKLFCRISANVQAFTNPHRLKPKGGSLDLAGAGLSADSTPLKMLLAYRGANAPMREYGVRCSTLLLRVHLNKCLSQSFRVCSVNVVADVFD
ncbi:hypothetical protein D3C77_664180 [compost metagenome]